MKKALHTTAPLPTLPLPPRHSGENPGRRGRYGGDGGERSTASVAPCSFARTLARLRAPRYSKRRDAQVPVRRAPTPPARRSRSAGANRSATRLVSPGANSEKNRERGPALEAPPAGPLLHHALILRVAGRAHKNSRRLKSATAAAHRRSTSRRRPSRSAQRGAARSCTRRSAGTVCRARQRTLPRHAQRPGRAKLARPRTAPDGVPGRVVVAQRTVQLRELQHAPRHRHDPPRTPTPAAARRCSAPRSSGSSAAG